jgi:formylglycine-generating enzyme required for sulfatase activity
VTAAHVSASALVAAGISLSLLLAVIGRNHPTDVPCGAGFRRAGFRCNVEADSCPVPLVRSSRNGCDAPDLRILIPAAQVAIGSSDWELEGRLPTRVVSVSAFRIDAFEVTRRRWNPDATDDPLCAARGMTRRQAEEFCLSQGGRLPTEDEWMAAATSGAMAARRYPWGDTGAVCRRAAWGLVAGPCAQGGEGPDTVGAHADGDSPSGLHDLAGNVAEWVAADPARPNVGVAKGGSWRSALAAELRIWSRLELSPNATDAEVGLRCVYPP